jgi:hypothetical protein
MTQTHGAAKQAGWAEDLADELVFLAKLDGTPDQLDADMTKRVSRHEKCPQVAHCIHTGHKVTCFGASADLL